MTTAMGTAFSGVQSDVGSALTTILPYALAIAGAIWVFRRVFRWFSSTASGR